MSNDQSLNNSFEALDNTDLESGLQSLNFDDVSVESTNYARGREYTRGRGRGREYTRGRGRGRGQNTGRGRGQENRYYRGHRQTQTITDKDGFQTIVQKEQTKSAPSELYEFDQSDEDLSKPNDQGIKLTSVINNVSHYLELAKEAIYCLCKKALNNIQNKQDKITSDTRSMNVLGPIFRNDFYIRLDDKKYAFAKESVVNSGKLELDSKVYDLNVKNTIRLWDILCGPNDNPKLLRENGILSLGEKLQKIVQDKVREDLIAENKLGQNDAYTPTIWLFLAYRYNNDANGDGPSRFINMCWPSDGTAPKSLIKVSDYCERFNSRKKSAYTQRPKALKMDHPMTILSRKSE